MFLKEFDAFDKVQFLDDDYQIDGVEVFPAEKTSGQIGFGMDRGLKFGAQGAEETKDSLNHF